MYNGYIVIKCFAIILACSVHFCLMEYLDGPKCVNIDTTSWGKKNFDFSFLVAWPDKKHIN